MAFVTFWYYADALTALNAKISIDGQRIIKISIPRDNKKTPQKAMEDKVEKKPRQEFARQNTKARNSSQRGSSSRVTLFLISYILLKCPYYNFSLLNGESDFQKPSLEMKNSSQFRNKSQLSPLEVRCFLASYIRQWIQSYVSLSFSERCIGQQI
jgi:hypothetical protein